MKSTREERIEQALFLGGALTLGNAGYRKAVRTLAEAWLHEDLGRGDLTAKSLGIRERDVHAAVISQAGGIVAGLDELAFLFQQHGIGVAFKKRDGDSIQPDEVLLQLEGTVTKLLALERVGLNLVQRMSGIATEARCVQERARRGGTVRIVGTRKTPWGLLDKRALHIGGVGTHRLGLWDAILIKNNHLVRLAKTEEEAAPIAIERAWKCRMEAAFIEVEVCGAGAARAAACAFQRLQETDARQYPCLLMLDNMTPEQIGEIIKMLQREDLWRCTLIEASGGISKTNIESYAATGVDAISIGALTHSTRALDICLRIS